MSELAYASAVVGMLDRDSQTVRKFMTYPITRVELYELRGEDIVCARTFVVGDGGRWEEMQ